MATKNLSIGQVSFNSAGLADNFSASIEKDGKPVALCIYIIRNGKNVEFKIESAETVRFSNQLYGKLSRLLEQYDKLGRKSIDL